jgi:hypothetical protein
VSVYLEADKKSVAESKQWRERARTQVTAARKFERQVGRLLEVLDHVDPLIPEAMSLGYLPDRYGGRSSLATLIRGGSADELGRIRRASWDGFRRTVRQVARDAASWRRLAHADSLDKRGRKHGGRVYFAEWVAIQLVRVNIRLTKNADGKLGRVLGIMYDAAGVAGPEDLYRDVAHAVDKVREVSREQP